MMREEQLETVQASIEPDELQVTQTVTEEKETGPSVLSPNLRFKTWKTVLYCYTFIMVGAALMAMSPTLLRLSEKVGVSVESMSVVFTVRGIGYVITVLLVGLLFDKYSLYAPSPPQPKGRIAEFIVTRLEKIIMIVSLVLLGISLFVTPLVNKLWLLIVINLVLGISAGAIDVICNLMVVTLWEEAANPYLQALHFCYGLGSFLCPLYMGVIDTVYDKRHLSPKLEIASPVSVFFITLAVVDLSAVIFFVGLLFEGPRKYVKVSESSTDDVEMKDVSESALQQSAETENPATLSEKATTMLKNIDTKQVIVTVLTSVCICLYAGTENGYGGLIYTYVMVHSKSFSESTASYLATAFWLSFTATRAVAIVVSKFATVRMMLVFNIMFTMASILTLIITNNHIAIWVATVVMGIAMASQYSNTIALPTSHLKMKMTGVMASIIVTGGSIGEMVMPILVTALLKWLMPICFAALGIASALYIVLLFFIRPDKELLAEASLSTDEGVQKVSGEVSSEV